MSWSVLQDASHQNTASSTTNAVTTGINCTSGTKLIAFVGYSLSTTISVSSVKDAANNNFTRQGGLYTTASGGCGLDIWTLDTPAGDVGITPTITATFSVSATTSSIYVQEVSGLLAGSTGITDGAVATNTGGNGTFTGVGPPVYASSTANEYLAYAYADNGVPETMTVPSGYSTDSAKNIQGSSSGDLVPVWKNSTGGTETGSFTPSNTAYAFGDEWVILMVAFRLAGGGGPAPLPAVPLVVPPGRRSPMAFIATVPPLPQVPASLSTAVPIAESGAAEDTDASAFLVSAAAPAADPAAAAETLAETVTAPAADPAAAADALAETVTAPAADVAAAGDLITQSVAAPEADPAAAADTLFVTAETLPISESGAAAEALPVSAQAPSADQAAAAEFSVISATAPAADLAGAADALTVQASVPVADLAAASEFMNAGVPVAAADVAGASDALAGAATAPLPDVAAAADAASVAAAVPQADAAGAAESVAIAVPVSGADYGASADVLVIAAIGLGAPDAAGAAEALAIAYTVPGIPDAAGAADSMSISTVVMNTGHVRWQAHPAPPRWLAVPARPRWGGCAPATPRWLASAGAARWHASPASWRWRIIMSVFQPLAAISTEYVNVLWSSGLDGTSIDPTGQTQGQNALTVQMAFPVSSGNFALPAEPSTWYPASWLLLGTGAGYYAQCLVGPGVGGVVTLTAGQKYDVWSQITGTPELPKKFAGTLTVY